MERLMEEEILTIRKLSTGGVELNLCTVKETATMWALTKEQALREVRRLLDRLDPEWRSRE